MAESGSKSTVFRLHTSVKSRLVVWFQTKNLFKQGNAVQYAKNNVNSAFSDTIPDYMPACLPKKDMHDNGVQGVVSGWGLTRKGGISLKLGVAPCFDECRKMQISWTCLYRTVGKTAVLDYQRNARVSVHERP